MEALRLSPIARRQVDTPGKKLLVGVAVTYLALVLLVPTLNVFVQARKSTCLPCAHSRQGFLAQPTASVHCASFSTRCVSDEPDMASISLMCRCTPSSARGQCAST